MKAAGKAKAAKAGRAEPARNAFIGMTDVPSEDTLAAALGEVQPLWNRTIAALMKQHPELAGEWKCSSPKLGWGYRLTLKKRNIIYFSPCADSFHVGLVLGEKSLKAVREAGLPKRICELIAAAPKYAEGTGVRFEVREEDVEAICKLATIKISN